MKQSLTKASWEILAILRFFLSFIVLSGHFIWFTGHDGWIESLDAFGGVAAVVGFLLISGYSIAASFEREADGFYRRRFLRVYPLYFCAVTFAFALEIFTSGHLHLPGREIDSLGWTTAAGNLLFLQTFAIKPIQFDGPVWSLAIEAFYYLLAPLFARLDRRSLLTLVSISIFCYALPKHNDWGLAYFALSKFNALNYLWCWLLGFLLWREPSPLVVGFALIGVPLMVFGANTPQPLAVVTYAITLSALIFARRVAIPAAMKSFANYLGDVSYPLYVFHLPALILGYAVLQLRSSYALVPLAVGISIIALHLVDRFLKRRFIVPLLRDAIAATGPAATRLSVSLFRGSLHLVTGRREFSLAVTRARQWARDAKSPTP